MHGRDALKGQPKHDAWRACVLLNRGRMNNPAAEMPRGTPEARVAIAVLLVDDQRFVAVAVERLLATERDMVLHCCCRSTEAIALANRIHPAVILQDLVMPDIDGLTMVRMFRDNPATLTTPIVVLSGNDDAASRGRAMAQGANDYLVKLPPRAELVACIRRHATQTSSAVPSQDTAASCQATVAAAPTFDRRVLAQYGDDEAADLPDFVLSLIDLFIEEAGSQVELLRVVAGRLDAAAMKTTAHSLKGSSMTIGAQRLAVLCAQMEAVADCGDAAVTTALVAEFDREFEKVRFALTAERQGQQ